jgi:hypothetical protein
LFSSNVWDFPFGDFTVSDATSIDSNSSLQYFVARSLLRFVAAAVWLCRRRLLGGGILVGLFWSVYCSVEVLQHKCGRVLAGNEKPKHE